MTLPTLRSTSAAAMLACCLLGQAHAAGSAATVPPAATTPAAAAVAPLRLDAALPVGPQVKLGKLANGLSYYIQRNGRPEKKLELRLVVKAGSILEDEDQLGLAHFTEHMAFNGSSHFKRHELVSYLQAAGVKFGADLNAYTGFDETVYILPLPTDDPQLVARGFQVLEDWAHGLSFNPADIDSERGIVLEELRLGKGATDRINKVLLPKVLNGSRYAERLPIGKEEVLKTFSPDAIKRFYHDWYRPELMAVVVVGDIDPAEAERLIAQHFGPLKNPVPARPRPVVEMPEPAASESLVVTDKEAGANAIYIRYPIQAKAEPKTVGEYRQALVENLYGFILGQRMHELTQQAKPPFIQGGSGMGTVVRGYRSFTASAVLGQGGYAPAVGALMEEGQRARQFGFSAAELERAKKTMLRNYERLYQERDKMDSAAYVGEYLRHFLAQEAIPGIDNEYRYAGQLVPGITLEEVNAAARLAIPAGGNKLVVYTGAQREGVAPPLAAELLAAVNAAEKTGVKAREEKVYASVLMERPPKAGSIVKQSRDERLGLTELTLSNGVKVVLKPTDFNNDQVLMSAVRFGGQSLFDEGDIFNARYASAIVGQMGVLDYSPSDLSKILAGKAAGAGTTLGWLSETVSGRAASADVETMLQLAYLEMTRPRQDAAIYSAFIDKQRELAKTSLTRPEAVFNDAIAGAQFNNHPRVARAPRPQDFDHVDLARVMEIYNSRMASAKDFTFFLVGSFDVERIKPLLATYLGGLPTPDVAAGYKDLGVRPARGVIKKEVRFGAEAKSLVALSFTGDAVYSEAEQMRVRALVEVLNLKLVEVLREQMGLIYSGEVAGGLAKIPYPGYAINIKLPCGPENVDQVIAATFAEIRKVQQQGVTAADLDKVRAGWAKSYRKGLRENGYWLAQLQTALVNGSDPAALLDFEARANAITPAELAETARRYFDMDNYLQAVLYPQAPAKRGAD
ncbi:M16 family metallopeptidase [Rugamonas sp. CCM 8940]|uniref:M16 family metallopeptidase n=1 Tax=Rugamonas sp. CCM 8940 TaxID=2765359 RepID=UPI0018F4FDE9|nr:insulinase family protein [Rugamonas sp. CCM 8940]MBJ7313824.1 insulinase family protein [Rugamonas sp. CCM 8940]